MSGTVCRDVARYVSTLYLLFINLFIHYSISDCSTAHRLALLGIADEAYMAAVVAGVVGVGK